MKNLEELKLQLIFQNLLSAILFSHTKDDGKITTSIFLGSKITADSGCSHEIKTFLRRKAMTKLDSVFKSRDITLPAKVHIVKAMAFPIVTYGSESWTIKKAECQRTDVFEPWCWRRL